MNLTCPEVRVEVNQHECAKIVNFKMELSIIYKKCIRKRVQVLREISLDVNQIVSFDFLHVNLTSNIFMWILIFDQIYRKMKKEASVKHDLMKKIIHTEFLRENLLKQDFELENEHILYETKIPDSMKFSIIIQKVECILFTKDDNNTMKALIEKYQLTATLENRVLTATHYFAYLALLSEKLNENYLKTKGFIYQESRDTRYEDIVPRRFLLKFDAIDLFYNCDLMLSASNDLNDLVLISKYFKRQNLNYRVQHKISFVESVEITGNSLIVDWFLGGRRYLKFKATDVKTVDTRTPWSKQREGSMHYSCSTMVVTHTKFKKIIKNPNEIDFSSKSNDPLQDYEKLEDEALKVTDFHYIMNKTKKKFELIFTGDDLGIYIPNHLHFGAIIKAMMKQIRFQIRWHKIAYKEYKVQNRVVLPPRPISEKTDPREFKLVIRAETVKLRGEDKNITKCLIYHNEIVSALNEKGLTKCNPQILHNFRKQLIKNKVQEDYACVLGTNVMLEITVPRKYYDRNYCLAMIKELDEAKEHVNSDTFDFIKAVNLTITSDDAQWCFRNFKLPLIQMKNFKFSSLLIEALLNHNEDSEFILKYEEKIYEKYCLPNKLRKLFPKTFYNTEISSSHTCVNVQGFDTLFILYDLGWFMKRFFFADLCDSFPKNYRIKLGFTPLDLLRYRYHGKLSVNMGRNEINIYKERNFQRHHPKFRITIHKIEFFQCINYVESTIKNINITKEPLKDFETQILRIPLIETILRFQYNNAKVNNHYRDIGCRNIEEYLENIKNYSTHNIAIQFLLHIPSLRSKDSLEVVKNDQILPYFIRQSRVPVFHFQKTYMRQIYDLICEYVFKKDYSVKENIPQYPINYDIRAKALISDLFSIFSDFDYDAYTIDSLGSSFNPMNPKTDSFKGNIRSISQEQFLDNYNGLIVKLENFFLMNKLEAIYIKDYLTERMKFRIGEAESRCECFQIAYLTPSNLLAIRDKNFERFRLHNYDESFDNIRFFCEKFDLDYEDFNLCSNTRKTLFPGKPMDEKYETSFTANYKFKSQNYLPHEDFEDFIFSNKDTIAVVKLFKYKKNDEIRVFDMIDISDEISHTNETSMFDHDKEVKVTHSFNVLGLRMLYTLNIEYLFYHHFFENFNLEEYKKSDYLNINSNSNYDPFLGYKNNKKSKKSKKAAKNANVLDELEQELNNPEKKNETCFEDRLTNTKKELFMVLDVDGPQLNFQNELSNSQLLLVGKGTMRVSLFNYVYRDPKNPRKKYSVKKQIKFFLSQMDAYVAPTIINIVSPTFWLNANDEFHDNSEEIPEMENLLRKIMETEKAGFNFDINNKDFCNHTKPLLSIEIKIHNTKATFTPQNWWHFIFVIQSILFASGEKSTEKIFLDKLRTEELETYKLETLSNLIQK